MILVYTVVINRAKYKFRRSDHNLSGPLKAPIFERVYLHLRECVSAYAPRILTRFLPTRV
jgi:hypothetical protein